MSGDFSIIIPSFNGKDFLRKSLFSLQDSNLQPRRLIVVDDFSSDGTIDMLTGEFPKVLKIRNKKNLGPTASRNQGAKLAEGKYLIFMDNDVIVRKDSVEKLLSFLENTDDAGMVGGKSLDETGNVLFYNMGNRLGMGFIQNYERSIAVSWIIESFIAVRKALFDRLGGFDESYFMFGEGPDLSERMRKAGYPTYFVHDAVVTKLDGHTHPQWKRKFWHMSSFYKFWFKHGFKEHGNIPK